MMIGTILKFLGGGVAKTAIEGVTKIFTRKVKKQEKLDAYDAKYNTEVLKAGKGSLKDEYIIFLMTLPLLLFNAAAIWDATLVCMAPTPELDCGDALRDSADWLIATYNNVEGFYLYALGSVLTFVLGKGGATVYQDFQQKKRLSTSIVEPVKPKRDPLRPQTNR